MSDLTNDVLQDFADTVIGPTPEEKQNTMYGTIVEKDEVFYAKIDGSEELTPVNAAVEIEHGDRVLLRFENRELTAIGNVTAPASARTATNFMKLTSGGLMVGELDKDGKPTGSYTLMKPGAFVILDDNNRVLANFSSTSIDFGNKASFGEDGVILRDGVGDIMAIFNHSGVTLNDKWGRTVATFSEEGVNLYDPWTGSVMASFENDSVSIGNDGKGNPILVIDKDAITTNEGFMTLISKKQTALWARTDNNNYVYLKCNFDDNKNPVFDVFGRKNGKVIWEFIMDQFGINLWGDNGVNIIENNIRYKIATEYYVDNKISSLDNKISSLDNKISSLAKKSYVDDKIADVYRYISEYCVLK